MKNCFIIIVLFLTIQCGVAQELKPGKAEKRWALWHPFAALKVKRLSKKCYLIYSDSLLQNKLDKFHNGGKLDAFRHVFFMASFAQKMPIRKLRKLGLAHEKQNYNDFLKAKTEFGELPDSLSTVMDLQNNELGFKLGTQNKKLKLEELSNLVLLEITIGHAFILKRNSNGEYLTCNDEIIMFEGIQKKWSVPKCLVNSNQN